MRRAMTVVLPAFACAACTAAAHAVWLAWSNVTGDES
jgi:hypothetical protein